MKRLPAALASLAAICVLTLGLSGCNANLTPYAAIVNGSEISQAQLRQALSAIDQNPEYRCTVVAGGTKHLLGAGQGTYSATFADEVLSILIQDKAVHQDIARLGLPEPASLYPVALAQIRETIAPASGCSGSGASLVAAFPASYRERLLVFQADEDALAAHLAGTTLGRSAVASFVSRHATEMALACVSVIQVGSRTMATSLRQEVLGGASFAALARAHSTDSASAPEGGAIGCIPDTDFDSPLNKVIAALVLGRVSNPVAFNSSWLLLLVTQRHAETYSEVISSLLSAEQDELSTLFPRVIRAARVEVDPQYGNWDTVPSLARVRPNVGPPAAFVPNSAANTGPSS
ncbi:MAG: peptidylprolyl isomerase [Acidimicrobiales bacterium]